MKQSIKQIMEKLLSHQQNSIKVEYAKPEGEIAIGSSKFGGNPDVPKDFVYPYYEGNAQYMDGVKNRPLSFMAQINLADVSNLDSEKTLPKTGLLSFFYEMKTMEWGYDPKHKGSAKVFYFEDITSLERIALPEDMEEEFVLDEIAINFSQKVSVPDYDDFSNLEPEFIKSMGEEFLDDFYDAQEEMYGDDNENITKLLGHANIIQREMRTKCVCIERGYYLGDGPLGLSDEEKAEIIKEKDEWMLLFQMGSTYEDGIDIMFGDMGNIYFWIKKEDLKNKNFDNIWLILQCS